MSKRCPDCNLLINGHPMCTCNVPDMPVPTTNEDELDEILGLFATNLLHPFTCKRNDCYQVLSGEKWHYGIDKTAAKTALTAYVNEQVRAARIDELKLAGQYLQFQDPDYAIARIAALLPKDKEK